jgi:outer membrane immunogenic protein
LRVPHWRLTKRCGCISVPVRWWWQRRSIIGPFYVGSNVGYSWGNANTDLAGNGSSVALSFPNGLNNPPTPFPFSFTFADSNNAKLNGVVGGGQAGYNYQFSASGVAGFDADIQGSGERGSGQLADPFTAQVCQPGFTLCPPRATIPLNGSALTSYQAKIDWFGTVRGRLGFLVDDRLLIYGTGGLAYGHVAISGNTSFTALVNAGSGAFTPTTAVFDASKTNIGFALGGGIEGRFSYWANWTWKVEYLYLDLGSLGTTTSYAMAPPSPFITPLTGTITTHPHFTDNILRVGLNYKFGNYYAPAVYK